MAKAVSKPKRKSWQEKMNVNFNAKVETTTKRFADIPEGSRMFIATPHIVDAYVKEIPKGHFTEIKQIRKDLAAANKAEYTCPVTTGIFLRIIAEAAYEEYEKGKPISKLTPFWRALNPKSPSAKKLSFGIDFLLAQQKKEKILIE
jgi:hypothetical protein